MVYTGLKLEIQNEVDSLFFSRTGFLRSWEQQYACPEGFNLGLPDLLEFEPFPLSHQMSIAPYVELNNFEDISGDLGLWDFDQPPFRDNVIVPNPTLIMTVHNNHIIGQDENVGTGIYDPSLPMNVTHQMELSNFDVTMDEKRNGRYKSSALQLEEIQKYFDVPITRAAKELNVGLTILKKRCRELNIMRWPHRKIKSLKSLIHNVKVCACFKTLELGLTNEVEMLEEHKRMVEKIPEMELTERTKKLRQACFKANYKKRRSMQQNIA
ncbi:hypothetical protein DH2020_048526 [Rehmannia glutinosa]|uniref:RWP-RK domain-containing protein n=1 Tax=Rehmannia glutinosa TaxID=99300 RepID=A0ABR0U5R4_REHGL